MAEDSVADLVAGSAEAAGLVDLAAGAREAEAPQEVGNGTF